MIGTNNVNKTTVYFSDENKLELFLYKNMNNEIRITKQYINIIYLNNLMSPYIYNTIYYYMNKKIKSAQLDLTYIANSYIDNILLIKNPADFDLAIFKLKNNDDKYLIYFNDNQFDNDDYISINIYYLDDKNNVITLDDDNKIKNLYRIIKKSKSIYKVSFNRNTIANIIKLDFDKYIVKEVNNI